MTTDEDCARLLSEMVAFHFREHRDAIKKAFDAVVFDGLAGIEISDTDMGLRIDALLAETMLAGDDK